MESIPKIRYINVAALVILLIGSTQFLGYLLNIPTLKGIGFASVIAPFPKVFSDVDGLETFASDFTLILTSDQGKVTEQSITPELYSKLTGPYNRRNVYGAALSYAPRLKEEIWRMVFCYAFYDPGVLRHEFELPVTIRHVAVRIQTKTKGRSDQWILDPKCSR